MMTNQYSKTTFIKPNIPLDGKPFRGRLELTYQSVLPVMSPFDREQREKQLIQLNQIIEPLIIRHPTSNPVKYELVDGYEDYQIALKYDLPFHVILLTFDSKEDVIDFLLRKHLYKLNLNLFMKGVLVLRYKHIYQQKGKENMSLGGKGCENSQKVNTYKDLGNLIRCSDNTLRRIEKINATLKQEDELRVKLESGEVSINEAYNIIFLKNDSNPVNDHSPKSLSDASSLNSTVDQFEQETKDLEPKFSIRCAKKYQIVYLRPNWNYGNQISWHDRQVEDLSALNINDFTLEKSVTMFIQVPPKFQIPIQELARSWGFEFVTSLSVRMGKYMYSSPYAKQVNEYLLVFEKHGVGAPILPKIELGISEINETEVFSVIENLYRSELPKIAIFTSNRRGWDVYDFDKHSQKMVWQYRTIHVEVKKIA